MFRLAITAIELTNHGPLRGSHRVEIPPEGLAVLVGQNESGKTTLLGAVAAVLWGKTEVAKNRDAVPAEPHCGALEWLRAEPAGLRRFRAERDFETHQVAAWELCDGQPPRELFRGTHNPAGHTADQRRWPEGELRRLWGPISHDAFCHVAMLAQPLPDELERRCVQELITGSQSSTADDARERLVERFREFSKWSKRSGLHSHDARDDRQLERLEARREQLCSDRDRALGQFESVNQMRARQAELDGQAAEAARRLRDAEQGLALIKGFREQRQELDRAGQQAEQWESARRQAAAAEEELKTIRTGLAGLPAELGPLPAERLGQLRRDLAAYRDRARELVDPEQLAARREALQQQYAEVRDWPENASGAVEAFRAASARAAQARDDLDRLRGPAQAVGPRPDAARRSVAAAGAAAAAAILAGLIAGLAVGWLAAIVVGLLAGLASGAVTWAVYQPHRVGPEHAEALGHLAAAERRWAEARGAADAAHAAIAWTSEADLTRLVQLAERHGSYLRESRELEAIRSRQQALRAELDPGRLPEPLPQLWRSCRGDLEAMDRQLEQTGKLRQAEAAAQRRLAAVLEASQCADAEGLQRRFQEAGDRRVAARMALDQLVREHALAEELKDLPGAQLDARRDALQREGAELHRRARQIQEEQLKLRADLHLAERAMSINLAETEVELAGLEAEMARVQERCDAIVQARRLLEQAAQQYSAHHCSAVELRINELMDVWTGQPDRRFTVGADFALDAAVRAAGGAWEAEDLDRLSQGAQDQLAFAARLAVLERVGAEVLLPLLIDDAFLTWDAARRERLRATLQSAAQSRQIILATHEASFEGWGRQVAWE